MLQLDWYYKSPIDFEHKNYLLLDYLSKLDSSYSLHKLSPYLLWTEKLVTELQIFQKEFENQHNHLKREILGFSYTKGIIWSENKIPDDIKEIIEIVDYSKPILEAKIKLGYQLYKKYPQFLF